MENYKILLSVLVLSVLLGLVSCDDLLNITPLDAPSEETFFTSANDLRSYMNGIYSNFVRGAPTRWEGLANGTDNFVTLNPSASLNRRNISGQASETSALWNNTYDNIRDVNYFLENAYGVSPLNAVAKHYIGEGYYVRAFEYFTLLKSFGGVPFIEKPLDTESEELYRPRDPRDFIAEQIIEDLDSAIVHLDWKGTGEATAGRINKETALVLKSRVGLYEGSWEKYHGAKDTPFAVEGSDGTQFLQAAVEAGEMLINQHGANVYIGSEGREYFDLFAVKDYSNTPGAFFYKAYSRAHSVTHDWHGEAVKGWNAGLTKGLIDQYLMRDGKPASVSTMSVDETSMNSLAQNKDPRLGQMMWYPAQGTFDEVFGDTQEPVDYSTSMPGLITNQQREPTPTGYRIWKGTILDPTEWRNGETDDLIIRYAEGLLNYAEAKSLLGSITQADMDKSINVLRDRVGMPPMNVSEVNSWSISYSAEDGYDENASNIVNEIRRERRIELVLEGFRADDIKRWALMEEVYNGKKPRGAHLQEFLDYWNDPSAIQAEGFEWRAPEDVKLIVGENVDRFQDGFINPFWRNADFTESGGGYYIDPGRDYLDAIPKQEISLYESKGNVVLEQNPGWF